MSERIQTMGNEAMREAAEHLKWLKQTATDDRDNARIVGFEDCWRSWQAAQQPPALPDELVEQRDRYIERYLAECDAHAETKAALAAIPQPPTSGQRVLSDEDSIRICPECDVRWASIPKPQSVTEDEAVNVMVPAFISMPSWQSYADGSGSPAQYNYLTKTTAGLMARLAYRALVAAEALPPQPIHPAGLSYPETGEAQIAAMSLHGTPQDAVDGGDEHRSDSVPGIRQMPEALASAVTTSASRMGLPNNCDGGEFHPELMIVTESKMDDLISSATKAGRNPLWGIPIYKSEATARLFPLPTPHNSDSDKRGLDDGDNNE